MKKFNLCACLASVLVTIGAASNATANDDLCASYFDKQIVRNNFFGYGGNPASPPPIPSHDLRLIETKVVSSLSRRQAVGAPATRERFAEVWKSIDAWGADKNVNLVVTVDGWHAFAFPSKVPITQPSDGGDFYDIYADNGEGVHTHINPDLLSYIYAINLPANNGRALRNVSFYDKKGDLVFAIHATEAGKEEDPDLIKAFDKTWSVIAAMPAACNE